MYFLINGRINKHCGDDVPEGEDSYEEHLWYKVNTKYETSKLELSWINLGMRSHSNYKFFELEPGFWNKAKIR